MQGKGLADINPLVCFDACRTAGDIPGLIQLMGWARQFIVAGAGAFIGWLLGRAVGLGEKLAEAFYRAVLA